MTRLATDISSKSPGGETDLWGVNGIQKMTIGLKEDRLPKILRTLPDGKILVWEDYQSVLYRVNADGTLDTSFADEGYLFLTDYSEAVDDIFVTTNYFYLYAGNESTGSSIAKYFYDGTLDASFGTGGIAEVISSTYAYGRQLKVQSDGKLLAVGYHMVAGLYRATVARLNSNGSLDASFGSAGVAEFSDGVESVFPSSVILNGDGSMWLATSTPWATNNVEFKVQKLLADGSIDNASGFATGTGGVSTIPLAGFYLGKASFLKVLGNGKLVVLGSALTCNGCPERALIMRVNADGSADATFGGGDGIEQVNLGADVFAQEVFEVSSEVLLLLTKNGSAQITSSGSLDATYGTAGILGFPFSLSRFALKNYHVLGANVFVLGVFAEGLPAVFNATVIKLNLSLGIDSSFGSGGIFKTSFGQAEGRITTIKENKNGKKVVYGYTNSTADRTFFLTQLNKNGSLDTTFGNQGFIYGDDGGDLDLDLMELDSQGRILIAGSGSLADEVLVVRYSSEGVADATFGLSGVVKHIISGGNLEFSHLGIKADGKIHVGYTSSFGLTILRLLENGSLDTSFGTGGVQNISLASLNNPNVMSIIAKPDSKLVVAGYTDTPTVFLGQISEDGTLDATFDGDGILELDLGSVSEQIPQGMAATEQGDIFVLAHLADIAGDDVVALASVSAQGVLNTSFDDDGIYVSSAEYKLDPEAWKSSLLKIDKQKQIYAILEDGNRDMVIVNFDSSGAINSSFGNGGRITFEPTGDFADMVFFDIDEDGNFKISFENLLDDGILRVHRSSGILQ